MWERKYKQSLFGEAAANPRKGMEAEELRKGLGIIEEQYKGVALGESIKRAVSSAESGLMEATVRLVA